ncbi:MAG: cytochrome c maturation protein CcmE [Proteobacteria bacterium]|nr:cytochrome c maturation protein CcmE [Pseudomonadota bacterium]MBK9253272.1 cytochrome c maturation protein CcmE [Pseudomonadota bacterium]
MTPSQKRRLYMVLGILVGVGVATTFALQAFKSGIGFKAPTEVVAGAVQQDKRFQLGGMVKKGSVQRVPGTLEVRFVVTDFQNDVPVVYRGVLPDLFKEASGVTTNGRLDASGVFQADEVLAKHDENYMPPAVGRALKKGESRLEPPASPAPQQ